MAELDENKQGTLHSSTVLATRIWTRILLTDRQFFSQNVDDLFILFSHRSLLGTRGLVPALLDPPFS